MNRSRLIRAAGVLAAAVLVAGPAAPAQPMPEEIATIVRAPRGATINRAAAPRSGVVEEQARAGATLRAGDAIVTAAHQWVEALSLDGVEIVVEEHSDLVLGYRHFDPGSDPADRVHLLIQGSVQLTHDGSGDRPFRIRTPSISINLPVAGAFRIDVSPRGATRVSADRGWAEVVGNGTSVLLNEGESTSVRFGGKPGRAGR